MLPMPLILLPEHKNADFVLEGGGFWSSERKFWYAERYVM